MLTPFTVTAWPEEEGRVLNLVWSLRDPPSHSSKLSFAYFLGDLGWVICLLWVLTSQSSRVLAPTNPTIGQPNPEKKLRGNLGSGHAEEL